MSWIYVLAPLIAVVLVFIAYFGGKAAGREQAKNDKSEEEARESDIADRIISNNSNLSDADFAAWLCERAKK